MLSLRRIPALFAPLLLAGCGQDTSVRTYEVPKEPVPAETAAKVGKVEPPAAGTPARTLGLIVPVGGKSSRFVKLLGPADAVAAVEGEFRAFAQSVRLGPPPSPKDEKGLEFQTPPGWRQAQARQMRQVTFQAGAPGKVVEVYVSGAFGGSVLENVNRWRGELGLPNLAEKDLPANTETLSLPDGPATLVDLKGTATGGGMGGMMRPPG